MKFTVCHEYFIQRGVAIYFQNVLKLRQVQTWSWTQQKYNIDRMAYIKSVPK